MASIRAVILLLGAALALVCAGLVLKQCRGEGDIHLPPAVVARIERLEKTKRQYEERERATLRAIDSAQREATLSASRADSAMRIARHFKSTADAIASEARRRDSARLFLIARLKRTEPENPALLDTATIVVDTLACVDSSWKSAYAARTQEAHQLTVALLHMDSALIAQRAATELERHRAEAASARLVLTEQVVTDLKAAISKHNSRCSIGAISCTNAKRIAVVAVIGFGTVKATQFVLKHWVK